MADADATSPRLQCPEEPLAIIQTLQQAGFQAVLAGGCVRDMLLGRHPHDWDIATNARPGQVEALFPRTVAVGRQFGIVIVVSPTGTHYEVATFRGEADYSDGRHPDAIQFVEMEEDVKRRDFTVNALLFDPIASRVLDFVGGEADLRRGLLRAVGVPVQRFQEDRLRLLRAIRFAANLGFALEESTWEAVKQCAPRLLPAVSQERIRDELEKMLLNGASRQAFHLLEKAGLLEIVLPEVARGRGIAQPPQFHPEGDVWNHTMLVLDQAAKLRDQAKEPEAFLLSALCHDFGKKDALQNDHGRIRALGHEEAGIPLAEAFLSRITSEKRLHKYVANMVLLHMRPNSMAAQRSTQKSFCHLFDESVCPEDLLLLAKADALGRGSVQDYAPTDGYLQEKYIRYQEIMARPYVQGADLVAAGFEPGKDFGPALAYAHKLRLAGITKEKALRQTAAYLQKERG